MINIENLSFSFKQNQPLFKNLNLDLKPGRTYGLFGLNGAGKTTLLNHISGMLFPARGECRVLGKPSRDRLPETMSELYILPEQFELPAVRAETFIQLHAPFYPRFDLQKIERILIEFEIDRQKNLPELSYGQRKKFLIAFGLATNTGILLMDEPTNGLDIPSKSQFRKIMATATLQERCTVISTHQVRDLSALIDQFTVLYNGKIIFDQSIAEISKTLQFKKIRDEEPPELIYAEEGPDGKNIICLQREEAEDIDIDQELLFNAVIKDPDTLNRAFTGEAAPS
jgi:ABC-2 type transport system ATP-binding protein